MAGGKLLNSVEESKLVKQIQDLEKKTTGEIHIHLSQKKASPNILSDSAKVFEKLKMNKTPYRNAVLIYISVKSHELSCIGDIGIKAPENFWKKTVDDLRSAFSKGDFFWGLTNCIDTIGSLLINQFPADGSVKVNHIPDNFSDGH